MDQEVPQYNPVKIRFIVDDDVINKLVHRIAKYWISHINSNMINLHDISNEINYTFRNDIRKMLKNNIDHDIILQEIIQNIKDLCLT